MFLQLRPIRMADGTYRMPDPQQLRPIRMADGTYRMPDPQQDDDHHQEAIVPEPNQLLPRFEQEYRVPAWTNHQPCFVKPRIELQELGLNEFTGDFCCPGCMASIKVTVKLEAHEGMVNLMNTNRSLLRKKAPQIWMEPPLRICPSCVLDYTKPKAALHQTRINWLFLYLTGYLGVLTKEELKFYCKERKLPRNGNKDKLLFTVAYDISQQLEAWVPGDHLAI